jgi:ribosome-binding protein aMBF1 (putative translation factor)
MKRITRDRHLTPEEAAKYNAIREEIESEKPEINARIRKRISEKRKQQAAESNNQSLGQRIRAAREALGESQVKLAAAAGISQGYLSQIETDEREPTLSIAARLAKALDISLDKLASSAT